MENWKRFLDACFSIWPFSLQDLNYFENVLNSLPKDIQFKPLIKSKHLPFLDVLVLKSGTSISSDIFHKVTHIDSCHRNTPKLNIPFSLAKRLCTVVSDETLIPARLNELSHTLKQRKYLTEVINSGIYA